MSDESKKLLQFPCYFPIKVIGIHQATFITEIVALTQKHDPQFTSDQMKQQLSQENKYISLTLTVYALDQKTLDALYQDLSTHPQSRMVL